MRETATPMDKLLNPKKPDRSKRLMELVMGSGTVGQWDQNGPATPGT
jgi:hypothetical protein